MEEGEVPQVNSTFEFFGWAFKNYLLSKGEEGVTTVSPKLVMYVGRGGMEDPEPSKKYVDAKVI